MAEKNIQMKNIVGGVTDFLFPKTKSTLVIMQDGKTAEEAFSTVSGFNAYNANDTILGTGIKKLKLNSLLSTSVSGDKLTIDVSTSSFPNATTSAKGLAQLTDSINSTSITTAATPNAVKQVYDLALGALSKSGGTITGNVVITPTGQGSGVGVEGRDSSNNPGSVYLSILNDTARIRVGGMGAIAGNGFQIQGPGDQIYIHVKSSGIFDNLGNKYWHAGNDGTNSGLDADLLDGRDGAYYAKAIDETNQCSISMADTRGVQVPITGKNGLTFDFKSNATQGLYDGGTYHTSITAYQWRDASGGTVKQLALTDNGNLWIRNSNATQNGWLSWYKFYNTGNLNHYKEKYITPGYIAANTNITIPNSRTFTENQLDVYIDGRLANTDDDYNIVNTTTIRFKYDLPQEIRLDFRITSY